MAQSMLTTIDNPFDPFTEYDEWLACDEDLARRTQRATIWSYLASIAKLSDELSPVDEALAIDNAIDEIIKYNVLGIYKKVTIED